jgi:hypothetical protein
MPLKRCSKAFLFFKKNILKEVSRPGRILSVPAKGRFRARPSIMVEHERIKSRALKKARVKERDFSEFFFDIFSETAEKILPFIIMLGTGYIIAHVILAVLRQVALL